MKTIYYTPGGGSLRAPSKKLLKCRPHREVQRQNGWTLVSFLYLALVLMVFGCNDNGDSTSSDTSTNSTTGSDSMSPVASDSDTASENSLPADTATYVAVPAGELRIASEAAGKYIGAAVDAEMLRTDTDYTTVLAREFNAVTPENETKWGSLAPYSNKRDYSGADEIVHHAKAYAQRIKGHTLIWHQQTPQWLKSSVSADELNALIKEHIEQTMTRYKGHIAAWDVVNEAVDTRTASGYTESIFYNVLGPGYIAQAFHLARAADPDALLYYNEVGIERMGPKADFTYELMKNLLAEGVPIDGIGFQAHLLMNRYPSVSNMRENFKRFADLGLRVNISELDARTSWMQGTHDQRMFAERIAFQSVVGACLNEPGCEGITFWGFTDLDSWINDDAPDDPLIFDRAYNIKPAYYGVRDGLAGKLPAHGINLIVNGDFANGNTDWTASADTLAVSVEAAAERNNASIACINNRTGSQDGLVQHNLLPALKNGGPFAFTSWIRLTGNITNERISATITVEEDASDAQDQDVAFHQIPAGQWTELSGYFNLGFNSTPTAITLKISGPGAGVQLCVSDVAIQALTAE